jgi:hypothetical protein
MPRVGFEATIPAFQRAKTVHALDRAATVIEAFLLLMVYVTTLAPAQTIRRQMNR